MDTRGDLLSCLMFGGRSRCSGKSLDTTGGLRFMFWLWFLDFCARKSMGISCDLLLIIGSVLCCYAARGGPGNRWMLMLCC